MSSVAFIARVDTSLGLEQAWDKFAKNLRESGAQDFQISSMEMTFYIGAAQAYALIADAALADDDEKFYDTMAGLREDLIKHMERNHAAMEPEGNT